MRRSLLSRTPKSPQAILKMKADAVFSKFIRQRDKGKCITCGYSKFWKDQHCGHYESRRFLSTRYDERNCNCQCYYCNIKLKGNMPIYTIKIIELYGEKILTELRGLTSKIMPQFSYQKIIDTYTQKCQELGYEY